MKINNDNKQISIYIHIPFCDSKCYYCNFCSIVSNNITKNSYFKALKNEILYRSKPYKNFELKTLYFGGGTPSCVDVKYIKNVMFLLKKIYKFSSDIEITVECNPNSINQQKLEAYKKIGINRISLGVQSFNKKSLLKVGRISSLEEAKKYKKQVLNCLKAIKKIGIRNISVDFIIGLPYQSLWDIKKIINKCYKYVDHFSCYMLQIEENTKASKIMKENEKKQIKLYKFSIKYLRRKKFFQYEISNFSKNGYESKHNLVYWEREQEYIGFGVSAHSFLNNTRKANIENIQKYINFWNCFIKQDINNIINEEKISLQEEIEEIIMLSLRLKKGLNLVKFKEKYYDLIETNKNLIDKYLKLNLIKIEKNNLSLTEKGILIANKIITDFF